MQTSESISTLMPALIAARGQIKPAGKSGKNQFDRYDYATELDWHNAVMPALLANKLAMTFSATEVVNLPDRTTKKGGVEHAVEVHGVVRLMHESGEWIEAGVCGQGQDRGDKAIYQAMTGAKKYGYAMLFSLPTTDDPEQPKAADERPVQSPAESQASDFVDMATWDKKIRACTTCTRLEEVRDQIPGMALADLGGIIRQTRFDLCGVALKDCKETGNMKLAADIIAYIGKFSGASAGQEMWTEQQATVLAGLTQS